MHHVVVHAHCYQPPRENPWLEVVESEPSAAPDHNWNARIDRECYARLANAEVRRRDDAHVHDRDAHAGLSRLVNLYAWCTFDVGATLCEWLETESPSTLQAMIHGDAASVRRWGHGNAMAAPYHHVILPLASPRDRQSEVRWGIADFRRRFHREPEGMWLPECAADDDTLDLLAAEGIRFTILAPYQVRTAGETHGLPVQWTGKHGRTLTVLPYDGALAGEVAFGGLLRNAKALAGRLAPSLDDGQARCTTLATDGETFGHHHRGGDSTLAAAMAMVAARSDACMTNAASMVARAARAQPATLVSPSSWSCSHGIERWRSNCGCRLNHDSAPAQQWRGPLRDALQWLERHSGDIYEREGAVLFRDNPWTVRDHYGEVVASNNETLAQFVRNHLQLPYGHDSESRARELLEMQRASLRMFTSCAWFFDDVDRIETRQVLRYAARVIEMSGRAHTLLPEFLARLQKAHSPAPTAPTARDAFTLSHSTSSATEQRVAAAAIALSVASTTSGTAARCDFAQRIAVFAVRVTMVERTPKSVPDDVTDTTPDATCVYAVELHHQRTGIFTQWYGMMRGSGPSLQVLVASTAESLSSQTSTTDLVDDNRDIATVAMHEFPESVARHMLQQWIDGDDALAI